MPNEAILADRRIGYPEGSYDLGKDIVLHRCIWNVVTTFQFDTYREIVTARSPHETGRTGVPSATIKRYVLNDFPVPANQQVGRYA